MRRFCSSPTLLLALLALASLPALLACEDGFPAPGYRKMSRETLDFAKHLTLVASLLSLLGSSFIIFTYARFPSLRTYTFRLVVLLTCADALSSLHYVLGMLHDTVSEWQHHECPTAMCYFTGAVAQFSQVASFLWTACITYNIHATLESRDTASYERTYHAVSWGGSALCLLCVVGSGSLGHSGNWCWIRQDRQAARFLFYLLPLCLVMAYIGCMYLEIGRQLSSSYFVGGDAVTKRVRSYVLIFLGINAFIVAHRLQNFLHPGHPSHALFALNSFFGPMQGFGNALVYGCTRSVGAKYAELLEHRCPQLARRLDLRIRRKANASPSPLPHQQLQQQQQQQQQQPGGGGGVGGGKGGSGAGGAGGGMGGRSGSAQEVGILLSERVRYGGGATDSDYSEDDDVRGAGNSGGGGWSASSRPGEQVSLRASPRAFARSDVADYELSPDDEDFSV